MSADDNPRGYDPRIEYYIEIAKQLSLGDYEIGDLPVDPSDVIGQLGLALRQLAATLDTRYQELQQLDQLTSRINAGLLLDDILDRVYEDFKPFIPYDRIGFALIEQGGDVVRARWARTELTKVHLKRGYSAKLEGSSLLNIIETGQPRILNDLEEYVANKPESESTGLIVKEGLQASLTCPLIANGVKVGFIFFSSTEKNAYQDIHVDTFKRIANQLAVIVEKGRLVSELAAQKVAIEERNTELQQLHALKNQFVGIAAHDLRSPLSMIQMACNVMLDDGFQLTDEQRKTFLTDITDQTDHMLGLVNELLDVSHIESGQLTLRIERVRLDEFMAGAVARHIRIAEPKGTIIHLEELPAEHVYADARRLRQIVDNLISNAVKYSPPGSEVWVAVERLKDEWRISVKDQGPGIQPEDLDKLFQPFAQLAAQPTGGETSTGLGLMITRLAVEAHGGTIGVDTDYDQGALFWFTLPDEPPE